MGQIQLAGCRILAIWIPLCALTACGRQSSPLESPRPSSAASQLQRTVSGSHLAALINAINAGDSAAILEFGATRYSTTALEQSGGTQRLLNRWLEIKQVYGPIVVDSVTSSSDVETSIWARGTVSNAWLMMRLAADSSSPRRVTRIGLGRGIAPPYLDARTPIVPAADLTNHVDAYLKALAKADLFSGVVLLAHNGKPILERTYGMSDRARSVPLRMDSRFDLASIGKTFTAVAIMQLAERGKLSLGDTIARYVPGMPAAIATRITIGQLLEHSSGLGELGPALDLAMRKAQTVTEMVSAFTDTSLAFAPGTNTQYSNRGFVILGAIIERASGQRYADYVREHVFRPAGMTRTDLFRADDIPPDRAHRYTRFPTLRSPYTPGARVEFRPEDDLAPGPHGGAYSTATDLLRFANALSSGTLITRGSLETMTIARDGRSKGFDAGGDSRARYYGHAGGAPGMNSLLRVFPEAGYTLIVLSNYDSGANIAGAYVSSILR